jgi:Opacity protein and related surface antigens
MKTIFLAATVILPLLAGGPAQAADVAAKAPTYNPASAVYNWTGFYGGGHLGVGATTSEWRAVEFGGAGPFRLGAGSGFGVLGGAQVGFNYQVDALVFGLEADASWANLLGEACNSVLATTHCNSEADRFGTLAGRFGIAADRALIYFKGGAAWAHTSHELTIPGGGAFAEETISTSKWGWTAGAGVEYALTRNWSTKLEYDFMDFGTTHIVFPVPGLLATGTVTTDIKQQVHALKLGLNYKSDWGRAVAASY